MAAAERGAMRALGDAGPAARRALSSDARALRELNAAGREREVVQKFEAGAVGASEGAVGEYVKALVRLDRLDSSALLRTIQRGAAAEMGGGPSLRGPLVWWRPPVGGQPPALGGRGAPRRRFTSGRWNRALGHSFGKQCARLV